jgi:Ser/Thr protein kinase RdoA (MazF antagonist)
MRFELGVALARLDLALQGFDHPQAHRKHRWDLADAGQHQAKVALVQAPEKRQLLAWAFEQWTNFASPFLTTLPWQFIHGDGNPENIRVVDGKVVGLLDFGDSCYNPAVCDLAICLAYQMMDQADPGRAPSHFWLRVGAPPLGAGESGAGTAGMRPARGKPQRCHRAPPDRRKQCQLVRQ